MTTASEAPPEATASPDITAATPSTGRGQRRSTMSRLHSRKTKISRGARANGYGPDMTASTAHAAHAVSTEVASQRHSATRAGGGGGGRLVGESPDTIPTGTTACAAAHRSRE